MFEHIRSLLAQASPGAHFQAIATVASLVNPMVCALMFAGITEGESRAAAIRQATGAMLAVAAVLLLAAFAGAPILQVFGISLDAFSVAGGAVLILIGFSMLQGQSSPATPGLETGRGSGDAPGTEPAAAPNLGRLILFAASPGTITGVMTIVAAHDDAPVPVTAVAAILVVVALTWLLLVAMAGREGEAKKPGLLHDMASRYMGLIIVAMGIQFALGGFKAFMAG